MTSPAKLPFANSYIVPGTGVLAGEYPFHKEREPGLERLRALLDAGVTTFLDLTEEGESGLVPYAPVLRAEAAERSMDVQYHRVPVPDVDVPTREQTHRILAVLRAAAGDGERVYVHCWGGAGRTGVAVGCLLRERGLDGDAALAEVQRLFRTMPKSGDPRHRDGSPQTRAQRRYVRDWE